MSRFPSILAAEDYREAAMLRLREAQVLYDHQQWVGAIYLAGRAAEAILRSLLCSKGTSLEIGHDLRELFKKARSYGVSLGERWVAFEDAINELAVVWRNDLRFTGDLRLRRLLRATGRLHWIAGRRVKGDPLKANALSLVEAAEAVVASGDRVCRS